MKGVLSPFRVVSYQVRHGHPVKELSRNNWQDVCLNRKGNAKITLCPPLEKTCHRWNIDPVLSFQLLPFFFLCDIYEEEPVCFQWWLSSQFLVMRVYICRSCKEGWVQSFDCTAFFLMFASCRSVILAHYKRAPNILSVTCSYQGRICVKLIYSSAHLVT